MLRARPTSGASRRGPRILLSIFPRNVTASARIDKSKLSAASGWFVYVSLHCDAVSTIDDTEFVPISMAPNDRLSFREAIRCPCTMKSEVFVTK